MTGQTCKDGIYFITLHPFLCRLIFSFSLFLVIIFRFPLLALYSYLSRLLTKIHCMALAIVFVGVVSSTDITTHFVYALHSIKSL